ncbi:MAG: DUF616 domain-containing protein [Bacteroidales bacterium]|jgi:hypothetical protein|nr:DUF616 domain-containing protein [Bacteroidales bacterium]
MNTGKIAIYTCIVGGYDELKQPVVLQAGFDFICFVGKGEKTSARDGAWEIRELPRTLGDATMDARWAKTHPHVLLPDYGGSVWIDGNIAMLDGSLYQAVQARVAAGAKFSGVPHPDRDCSYAEARKCYDMKYLTASGLLRVWAFLFFHGLRRHAGLMESNLLFRQHPDPGIVALDELWWDRVLHLSRRDQLSLRWCLQRCGVAWDDRLLDGRNTRNHPGFKYLLHK